MAPQGAAVSGWMLVAPSESLSNQGRAVSTSSVGPMREASMLVVAWAGASERAAPSETRRLKPCSVISSACMTRFSCSGATGAWKSLKTEKTI